MKMHECPPVDIGEDASTVLLIHPMLSSAAGARRIIADRMGNDLRFLIPDLSAHGEEASTEYVSAADEARQIRDWLVDRGIVRLALGFGASLGGIVLLELVRYADLTFDRLFFEGASFYMGAPIMEAVLRVALLGKHKRAVANPEPFVRKMARLYGKEVARFMTRHFIVMSEQSVCRIVHDCGNVSPPCLSAVVQSRCTFAYGQKDFDLRRARRALPTIYPSATLVVWPGFGHCERLASEPDSYAKMLRDTVATFG